MKKLATVIAAIAAAFSASALDLTLDNLGGWSSTYDNATHTITYTGDWGAIQWWLGNQDLSAFTHLEVTTEPTGINGWAQVVYNAKDGDNNIMSETAFPAGATFISIPLNAEYSSDVQKIVIAGGELNDTPTVTLLSVKLVDNSDTPLNKEKEITLTWGAHILSSDFDEYDDDLDVRIHIVNNTDPYESRNGWGLGQISYIEKWGKTDYSFPITGKEGAEFDIYCTIGDLKKAAKNGGDTYQPGAEYFPQGGVTVQVYSACSLAGVYVQPTNRFAQYDGDVENAPVNKYIDDNGTNRARCLYITDGYKYESQLTIEAGKVSYLRNFGHGGWQTWHMPFEVALNDMTGYVAVNDEDGEYDIVEYAGVEGEYVVFNLVKDGTVKANTPYLFIPTEAGEVTHVFENVTVVPAAPGTAGDDSYQLIGTYEPTNGFQSMGAYVLSSGVFKQTSSDNTTLKPFRAYLKPVSGNGGSERLNIRVRPSEEPGTDSIIDTTDDNSANTMYDLNGRIVKHAAKGIYVINGQKIIIR